MRIDRPVLALPSAPPQRGPAVPAIRALPAIRAAGSPDGDARAAADVEVSLRLHADGTRIAVMRRTVADGAGRRTVGIDAVIG